MAYVGEAHEDPAMNSRINELVKSLLITLKKESPDIKVNAVCRLAAVMLATSDVTREQADKMMTRLFDSLNDMWMRGN